MPGQVINSQGDVSGVKAEQSALADRVPECSAVDTFLRLTPGSSHEILEEYNALKDCVLTARTVWEDSRLKEEEKSSMSGLVR